jgi:hypothetical protein
MSVLNAIKNKLVHRMFVCVNEDRMHQKTPPSKKVTTKRKQTKAAKPVVKNSAVRTLKKAFVAM